jgi:glucose/arabinose dehydrogenase
MEQPKFYWASFIAPSGMGFIRSDKYSQWQGKILLGSMKFNHLFLLEIMNNEVMKQTKLLSDVGVRVSNVIQGSDG